MAVIVLALGLLMPEIDHALEICCVRQVVREGTPCHLYFDLEFVPELNPGFDGAAAVLVLVELVRQAMRSVP